MPLLALMLLVHTTIPCEQACVNVEQTCAARCDNARCPDRCRANGFDCQSVCKAKRKAEDAKARANAPVCVKGKGNTFSCTYPTSQATPHGKKKR